MSDETIEDPSFEQWPHGVRTEWSDYNPGPRKCEVCGQNVYAQQEGDGSRYGLANWHGSLMECIRSLSDTIEEIQDWRRA